MQAQVIWLNSCYLGSKKTNSGPAVIKLFESENELKCKNRLHDFIETLYFFSKNWESYLRHFTISVYRYNFLAKFLLFSRKSYGKILENILKFYDGGPWCFIIVLSNALPLSTVWHATASRDIWMHRARTLGTPPAARLRSAHHQTIGRTWSCTPRLASPQNCCTIHHTEQNKHKTKNNQYGYLNFNTYTVMLSLVLLILWCHTMNENICS